MKMTKTFLAVAVAMAFAIAFTLTITTTKKEEELVFESDHSLKVISSMDMPLPHEKQSPLPAKRVSRFLVQEDPRPNYQCNKDNEVCLLEGSPGSTCCNNKCFDLMTDDKHCGACKTICKHTESCCNGKCVNLAFDKRHCGKCNNKCMHGRFCIYAMCDYA